MIRRSWGRWELYTSKPASLGINISGKSSIYHITLDRCSTPEQREDWLKHIDGKWLMPTTRPDLERAFNDLVKEGMM